ncbi:MAG: sulfur oxidation c-type cytochrome SoxX [Xanthobacteraceae bacterium]
MNKIIAAVLAASVVGTAPILAADEKVTVTPEQVERAVAAAWPNLPPDMQARVDQDETMKECSQYHNNPPKAVADAIMARAKATIVYPDDGKYLGDWKKGEQSALSGYGGRMGDDNPKRVNGGNCYACHQLAATEISYGTLGPSLLGYGKAKGFTPEAQKEVYERIYNPQSALACSNMPRFGHNKFLTVEQIKDVMAFLMDPESPVNK